MATFLLEVGTEELPASFVAAALDQWRSQIAADLAAQQLTPQSVECLGTPRRLAVLIHDLPAHQPQQVELVKGPPAQAAFQDGKPTKAAEGFAKKQGVAVTDLEIQPTEKGDFVFVQKVTEGQPTPALLTRLAPQWILGLTGKRFMRWGSGDLRFSRPIRWLVSLWDDQVLPIVLENDGTALNSDRQSQGHRVLHPEPVTIPQATAYCETLAQAFVQVDPAQRQHRIVQQVTAIAQSVQGQADLPPDLLQEVVFLVEWPTAVMGTFDGHFLELPAEVVTTEMVSHQRYFPVREGAGRLLPYFITISNGDPAHSALIASGNERVIRARLSDGQFFFQADQAIPLVDYLPKLETVTFQADLGSVRAKVDRIVQIAQRLAQQLKLEPETTAWVDRAALLCKADLVTQMVGEFPELQGIMGETYARTSGEPAAVATAIREHYQPRGAADELPQSLVGQVVAIADRLETLVSIFGLGLIPTGSSDPFGLRRATAAVVNILWAAKLPLDLTVLIQEATTAFSQAYPQLEKPQVLQPQLYDFFGQRLRTLLQDEDQIDYDLVNAVLGEADNPIELERALADVLDLRLRAQFLQQLRRDGTLASIYETINRATRLAAKGDLGPDILDPVGCVDPQYFQAPSEPALYDALVQLLPQTQQAIQQRNYRLLVAGFQAIAPTVSAFFDGADSVMVMAEDPQQRQNRLNLLALLRNHSQVLANFGEIVKT